MGFYQRSLQPRLLDATLRGAATGEIRRRVCEGLSGGVLEIGYGSGLNQPYLPPQVSSLSALEPSAVAFALSAERRKASPIPVVVVAEDAQALPLPDDHFDAALCTWSLCAIANPSAALAEVRRVLKPGGVLHFVEHGLSPDGSVAKWQRRGSWLNKRIAGCVLDRDLRALLDGSGLRVTALRTYYERATPKPAGYFYEGRAAA